MTFNWDTIAQDVVQGVSILAPIAETAVPEAAPALAIITKILQGAVAAEPVAVALVQQIQSGAIPTQTQLAQFYANYKTDDDALNLDIATHLNALDAAAKN